MQIIIYGAKALALGIFTAVRELYPECSVRCFMVTSLRGNPALLAGLPVLEIAELSKGIDGQEKDGIHVLVGTPEDMHPEIARILVYYGFTNYTCMDSRKESCLMEQYFTRIGKFPSIHRCPMGTVKAVLQVYLAKFYKDRPLQNARLFPDWVHSLQAGAQLTDIRVAEYTDDTGVHISSKNVNYCELTALYWIWKNKLPVLGENTGPKIDYYGLFHYRRILDITQQDLYRLKANDIDVILQFPTLHEPDISEHHARYMKEADWDAMVRALWELQPEYAEVFTHILEQPYFYNYNLVVAKRNVLSDYCAWLFPILERTEELSRPKGCERADRYIGYLGENLMTLYFLYNKKKLRIFHTGRLMLI